MVVVVGIEVHADRACRLQRSRCPNGKEVMHLSDRAGQLERAKGECSGAEDLVKRNIKTSGDLRKQGE